MAQFPNKFNNDVAEAYARANGFTGMLRSGPKTESFAEVQSAMLARLIKRNDDLEFAVIRAVNFMENGMDAEALSLLRCYLPEIQKRGDRK